MIVIKLPVSDGNALKLTHASTVVSEVGSWLARLGYWTYSPTLSKLGVQIVLKAKACPTLPGEKIFSARLRPSPSPVNQPTNPLAGWRQFGVGALGLHNPFESAAKIE